MTNISCRRIQGILLFLLFLDTFRIQGKDLHKGKVHKKKEKKLTNVSFMCVCVAKNGEMLGFLLGFVIYRIFYKGSKLTVVSLFNLSLTAPRRYFRLRRHYF